MSKLYNKIKDNFEKKTGQELRQWTDIFNAQLGGNP